MVSLINQSLKTVAGGAVFQQFQGSGIESDPALPLSAIANPDGTPVDILAGELKVNLVNPDGTPISITGGDLTVVLANPDGSPVDLEAGELRVKLLGPDGTPLGLGGQALTTSITPGSTSDTAPAINTSGVQTQALAGSFLPHFIGRSCCVYLTTGGTYTSADLAFGVSIDGTNYFFPGGTFNSTGPGTVVVKPDCYFKHWFWNVNLIAGTNITAARTDLVWSDN